MKTRTIVIGCVALAAVLAAAVFVFVSRARPTEAAFAAMLSQADALSESGEREKALSSLKRARGRAGSVTNWLSIAKREMALLEFSEAEESLRRGLKRFPANDRLSAALVHLLVRESRLDEAAPYLPFLAGTEFAPLAAYAEIALDAPDFSLSGDEGLKAKPAAYATAWLATGNPVFRRDAAVLNSLAGDYGLSLSLYEGEQAAEPDVLEGERLFRAILSYDSGDYPATFKLLDVEGDSPAIDGLTEEEALLAADALYLAEEEDAAALIWKSLFDAGEAENPLVFLNTALTSSAWREKRFALEKCLELFPSYYPALAVFVRSAISLDSLENYFPFYGSDFSAKALAETSHVSIGMEDALGDMPITLLDAESALDAALAASTEDDPYRLHVELERARFLCFQTGKDAEARHIIWNILEEKGGDNLAGEFALWFFAKQADFAVFLGLADNFDNANPIYLGVAAAAAGNLDAALQYFNAAQHRSNEWAAVADSGVVLKKEGAYSDAADAFALAADLAALDATKSRLYYHAAVVFDLQKAHLRAADMLRHAISLDEGNYSARTMLRRLEVEQGL